MSCCLETRDSDGIAAQLLGSYGMSYEGYGSQNFPPILMDLLNKQRFAQRIIDDGNSFLNSHIDSLSGPGKA